jgi:hypothetical protein
MKWRKPAPRAAQPQGWAAAAVMGPETAVAAVAVVAAVRARVAAARTTARAMAVRATDPPDRRWVDAVARAQAVQASAVQARAASRQGKAA